VLEQEARTRENVGNLKQWHATLSPDVAILFSLRSFVVGTTKFARQDETGVACAVLGVDQCLCHLFLGQCPEPVRHQHEYCMKGGEVEGKSGKCYIGLSTPRRTEMEVKKKKTVRKGGTNLALHEFTTPLGTGMIEERG